MKFKKNKKGLGFFALIVPVAIILMSLVFVLKISPNNDSLNDLEFTSLYKKVDLVSFEENSDRFFLNSLFDIEFEKVKSNFIDNSYISSSELLDNTQNDYTKDNFLSCRINYDNENLNIWYNEKNLKYYNDKGLFLDSLNSKLDLKNTLTKDEVLCINNYKDNFNDLISQKYEDDIRDILNNLNYKYNLDVNYDNNLNILDVNLKLNLIKYSKKNIGKITDKINVDKKYSLGNYPNLILSIQDSLPQLATASKAQVPKCVEDNSNEVDCMLETLKSLIKKQDGGNKVLSTYNFEIEQIPNFEDQKYLALKINVLDKKTNKKILDFGVVVEDNIPFSLVNFNLEDVEKVDNVVEVQIEKPKVDLDKIDKFIIMYSYDNFFSGLNSNYPYDKLIDKLKNREIPSNHFYDNYYLTDKDLNLDILVVDAKGFEKTNSAQQEIDDNKYYKKVDIYQKFNYETQKLELLKTQKLFVFVFALDKNNNYYLNNIEGKSHIASPKLKIGPIPLESDQILLNGNLVDAKLQNSLNIKTLNYDSKTFDHYDIYITERFKGEATENLGNNKKLIYGCKGVDYQCNYFSGSNILTNKDLDVLITGNQDYIKNYFSKTDDEKSKLSFPIFSGNFYSENLNSDKFILENGKNYDVYIIPVDDFGNSILSRITPAFRFKSLGEVKKNYYVIDQDTQRTTDIIAKPIKIIDNKPPELSDISDGKIINDNSLKFDFKISKDADISKIEGIIKFYTLTESGSYSWDGNLNYVYIDLNDDNKIKYTNSNFLVKFETDKYSKVEFSDLKLFDSNDNYLQTDLSYVFTG